MGLRKHRTLVPRRREVPRSARLPPLAAVLDGHIDARVEHALLVVQLHLGQPDAVVEAPVAQQRVRVRHVGGAVARVVAALRQQMEALR